MAGTLTKHRGIALRIARFSRTSHVVTWLTEASGIVTTVVKGALRPKSFFLGQYDLYYSCDLVIYEEPSRETVPLRECTPIALREGLRLRWRHAALASYLCDLVYAVLQPQQAHPAVYALLSNTLDELNDCPTPSLTTILLRFELQLLREIGLLPRLEGIPEACDPQWPTFSYLHVTFLPKGTSGGVRLPRSVAEQFIALTQQVWDSDTVELPTHSAEVQALLRLVGMLLRAHLEYPLQSRRICLELIASAS